MRNTAQSFAEARPCGRLHSLAVLLLCGALLQSCNAQREVRSEQLAECADPASPACAAARDSFQVVRYPTFAAGHLVAASNRALGDLDFETRRDDARRTVGGDYIANAPIHAKQLDDVFRQTLRHHAEAVISAEVEVTPLAGQDSGADVRLRLYALAAGAAAPQPIDSVAPYQVFFSQLGVELGAPPPKEELPPSDRPRARAPSVSGL